MVRIVHNKTATKPGDLNCSDWNSDHEIAEPLELADVENLKLLGYTLVEEKILPSGSTSCVFDNLNGDLQDYYLEYELNLIFSGSDVTVMVRPNNDSGANYAGNTNGSYDATSNFSEASNFLRLCRTHNNASGLSIGTAQLYTKSGKVRVCKANWELYNISGGFIHAESVGYWKNTTDLITSLAVVSSHSTFSGTIRLWKKIPVTGGS